VPREDAAHGGRNPLRSLLGAQPRGAQAIETALVQSLVSEAPGQTLTRLQLLTADGANFGSRARLDVGKRRRSQSGRTHGDSSSNADATESEIAETLYTRRVTTKSGNRD